MGFLDNIAKGLSAKVEEVNKQYEERTTDATVGKAFGEAGLSSTCELYMQQKFALLGDKYSLYDAEKNPVYNVVGNITGLSFEITTAAGAPVAEIKKKLVAITPEYKFTMTNGKSGEIKKKMALIKEEFSGKFDGKDLFIKGDVAAYDFKVEINGQIIGSVSKQLISWGDTYKIKAISEEWVESMAVIVVAIDNACHNAND